MTNAATLTQELLSVKAKEGLAFIGLPSKRSAKQLSGSAEEVIQNVGVILDQLLNSALDRRTAAEFVSLRDALFIDYARVMIALSGIVSTIVPMPVLARINSESLSELEADFREHALSAFGPIIQDQALFTVWTLRKIADLGQRILSAEVVKDQEKDREFSALYTYHALRTRFHLDCLSTSMRSGRPIYPEVLEVISEGLRSAVDAYAWIRQGADLRSKTEEAALEPIELDEEDREFLDASARDMAAEPI